VSEHSREELLAMRNDLMKDIDEMVGTLAWLDDEIKNLPPEPEPGAKRRYTWISNEQVRDTVRKLGEPTSAEIAEALGCSPSTLAYKLKPLFEAGTLIRIKRKGRVHYKIAKPQRGSTRSVSKQLRPLKLVSAGVPKTGKKNPKLMKRRGKIKGVGGH
jgi:DNA-binding transcriptional ArsR family regulator